MQIRRAGYAPVGRTNTEDLSRIEQMRKISVIALISILVILLTSCKQKYEREITPEIISHAETDTATPPTLTDTKIPTISSTKIPSQTPYPTNTSTVTHTPTLPPFVKLTYPTHESCVMQIDTSKWEITELGRDLIVAGSNIFRASNQKGVGGARVVEHKTISNCQIRLLTRGYLGEGVENKTLETINGKEWEVWYFGFDIFDHGYGILLFRAGEKPGVPDFQQVAVNLTGCGGPGCLNQLFVGVEGFYRTEAGIGKVPYCQVCHYDKGKKQEVFPYREITENLPYAIFYSINKTLL